MVYARDFFDLQIAFAEAVRVRSVQSLEDALFEYTNLYVRFGLGRDFDADHPGWKRYLDGLRACEDAGEWTYRFYLADPEARTAPAVDATFGCFSYAIPNGKAVRIHFRNTDPVGASPLDPGKAEARRSELASLLSHMKPRIDEAMPIVGASWLYNLRSYRSLFPPGYAASGRPLSGRFRSMALWGQFLDRRGQVRKSAARRFLAAVARASSIDDVGACFPFQVITVRAPASEFYGFFGV